MIRTIGGLVLGALVAALGALILGEYEFTGTLPYIAGPLFGLAVGETVVAVGRSRATGTAAATALIALGGITWAGWIDSSEGVEPMHTGVWVAAALAAVAAFLRTIDLRPTAPH
ncbi:MAG TPA: hypothetical protein VJ804_12955 [Acidimicrobiales bacterium]|nr:hypothetical protein [Acidimicrobiales bacterium]